MNFTGMETITVENEGLQEENYIEYQVAQFLWRHYPPFIFVLGTIGNVLCFLITMRKSMRQSAIGMCLAVLAVTDTLVLFIGVTRIYTVELAGWDIRNVHESLCKLQRFFLYFGLDFSAWILVTISIERYISVCYPFKANTMCTLSRTKNVLSIVAFLVTLDNSVVFWAYGREYDTVGNVTQINSECGYPGPEQKFFWQNIRPWIVLGLYALGPFTTMIICSIRIVRRLKEAKHLASAFTNGTGNSNQSLESVNSSNMTLKFRNQTKSHESSYKMHSMTVMSVVVAAVFLCLTTPSHLLFVFEAHWSKENPYNSAVFSLVESISKVLLYTNHGINFFVYCASGERFRKELKAMVTRKKEKPMQYLTVHNSTVKGSHESVLHEIRRRDGHAKLEGEKDS